MISLPAAFAAFKLKRPIRIALDRDEDMMMTGGRHPFLFKYKVGCTKDGKITALDMKAYLNAGYSLDCSSHVMKNAHHHITSAYNFKNVRFECNGMTTFEFYIGKLSILIQFQIFFSYANEHKIKYSISRVWKSKRCLCC